MLLTGATGGLGRTMAMVLAGAGAELVLTGRNEEELSKLASSLPGSGHSVQAADFGTIGAAVELAHRAGEIDILVNNAALPGTGRLDEFTEEQLSKALTVNLESPIQLTKALLPGMIERGRGKIVLIGSLAGKVSSPFSSIYNATKFGIRGFAFGLSADLAGKPVGVTLVAPGFVAEAGMFADAGTKAPPGLGTTTPSKVADAVLQAITGDKLEITVAPFAQRTAPHLGLITPAFNHRFPPGTSRQQTSQPPPRGPVAQR